MALFILGPDSTGTCCDCTARTSPCDSCEPTTCECSLRIPPINGSSPYSSYTAAVAAIEDNTSNCVGYTTFSDYISFVATLGTNAITIEESANALLSGTYGRGHNLFCNVSAQGELSVLLTLTNSAGSPTKVVSWVIWNCAGSLIHSESSSYTSPTTFTFTPPDEDNYTIRFTATSTGSATPFISTFTAVLSATTLVSNPVIALWDDSGTTRYLMACPKLEIPSRNNWFGNSTVASDALANPKIVASCIAYNQSEAGDTYVNAFTASEMSGVISVSLDKSNYQIPSQDGIASVLVCVNLESGSSISIDWSLSWNNPSLLVPLIDAEVSVFEAFTEVFVGSDVSSSFSMTMGVGSASGTLTVSGIPAKGAYRISFGIGLLAGAGELTTSSFDANIYSSGTLTENPIQALYLIADPCPIPPCPPPLGCPGRTNC